MVLTRFPIPGGASADKTEYSEGPRWVNMDKVRFQQGHPEKIGGWTKDSLSFTGVPSSVFAWQDLSFNQLLAVATNTKLYIILNNTKYDITPVEDSGTLGTDPFTTEASGSPIVLVADAAHGRAIGDSVRFTGAPSTIDGIPASEFNAEHLVTTVNTASQYEITLTTNATSGSTAGGGSSVTYSYDISTASSVSAQGLGWGASTWGTVRASTGGWGDPAATTASGIEIDPGLWSLDLWGEDLVATRRGSGTYTWDASTGVGTRATLVSNAPTTGLIGMVSNPTRHHIVFGARTGSATDPLLVAWSDQEDNTTWAASATNAAGNQRLHYGDKIVAAIQSRDQILVFTNRAVFAMNWSGPPFTFSFRPLAINTTIIAQHAATTLNGIVWWMGKDDFYVYDGQVRTLNCPIRDLIYDDLNLDLNEIIFTGLNTQFTEIMFLYPSLAATTTCDKYAGFNYLSNEWYFGTLDRCVWLDDISYLNNPLALNASGELYQHEQGVDDDTSAMSAFIESGDVLRAVEGGELGAGDRLILLSKLIPDAEITGILDFSVKVRKYPHGTETTKGPYDVTSATERLSFRAKGRQARIRLACDSIGDTFKWREPRFDITVSGKR